MSALSATDVERFITDGFLRLEAAFPRALADECRAILWAELGLDEDDPSTWTKPVIRLPGSDAPPFVAAANTPRLHQAFDQLVGAARWYPRSGLGTFPIRFPSEVNPGDAGWHIDGSFGTAPDWHVNLRSRDRALLLLLLFSDVGPDDAPTRIRVGSHLDVPPILRNVGDEGISYEEVGRRLPPRIHERPLAWATGAAGDVYLCHPFLVHAATWPHRGKTARFIAQPPLAPKGVLELERTGGDYSPVEIAVRLGLGLGL